MGKETGAKACRLTASQRRGLENIRAFVSANQWDGSELTPKNEPKLARDTASALAWIDGALSPPSDSGASK
jgi:hypothetical protein